MKRKLFFIVFLIIFVFGFWKIKKVSADCSSTDQACLQDEINQYNQKINELSGQANTLSNQIAQFNAQITLAELKIEQTQEQINLLGGRIDQLEGSLKDLSTAFSARALESYKLARTGEPLFLLMSESDVNNVILKFNYLKEIQSADQALLVRLQTAQDTYQVSKKQSEDLQKKIQDEQNILNSQKIAKAQLLTSTQNDEKKYQQLLAQAQSQLAAFRNFVSDQGGASILSNQTYKSDWGYYYNQRDSQWGNRGLGTSSLSVANYGCLISSSAMIATHYGKTINPGDIAVTASAFFSPDSSTALMWRDITVNGIRIIRNSIGANTSNIDSELAAGRPVIVGLYSGPAHFIVIKSGSNGNYVMNDPFMPNGHDVNFSSKYSVSDITDVESVIIQ